ncbi:MAG: glycosyltransferase family 39 protein [Anaerolineae bacterium]
MIGRLRRVPDRVWRLAILLLAFGLRAYRLNDQSLWFDESFTWWVGAALPWADLWPALLPFGAYTPLFYLLMRGVAAVGQSEYILRFPALFFGVLLIPVVERIGRRLGGPAVGRLAALLVAINPFSIWYAQDARMYTMASFFVLVAMDGFMRAIDGKGWRRSMVGAGAAYFTHYVTLFIAYIQLVWWLPRFRRSLPAFRRWFGSHLLAALPLLPWLAMYFSQPVRGLAIGWIPVPSPMAPYSRSGILSAATLTPGRRS